MDELKVKAMELATNGSFEIEVSELMEELAEQMNENMIQGESNLSLQERAFNMEIDRVHVALLRDVITKAEREYLIWLINYMSNRLNLKLDIMGRLCLRFEQTIIWLDSRIEPFIRYIEMEEAQVSELIDFGSFIATIRGSMINSLTQAKSMLNKISTRISELSDIMTTMNDATDSE